MTFQPLYSVNAYCLLTTVQFLVLYSIKISSVDRLQNNLDRLQLYLCWIWQLPFNIMILHLTRLNPINTYINSIALQNTSEIKDLELESLLTTILNFIVTFHQSLVKQSIVGFDSKIFYLFWLRNFFMLYMTIVRPALEYGNIVWGPFYWVSTK